VLPHPANGERLIGFKQPLNLNSLALKPSVGRTMWFGLKWTTMAPAHLHGALRILGLLCSHSAERTKERSRNWCNKGENDTILKLFRLSYFHPSAATESARKDKACIRTLSNHTWKAGVKAFWHWVTQGPPQALRSKELEVRHKFTKKQSDLI